jgi:hypothetical protein
MMKHKIHDQIYMALSFSVWRTHSQMAKSITKHNTIRKNEQVIHVILHTGKKSVL